MFIEEINGNLLVHNDNNDLLVGDYHRYCVNVIREVLNCNKFNVNIIFGDINYTPTNGNKTLRTDIQIEHTLVKPGGRDAGLSVQGKVRSIDNDCDYLARLVNPGYYNNLDFIIDYSYANLHNLQSCGIIKQIADKTTVISPLIHDVSFDAMFNTNRNTGTITSFTNMSNQRRAIISSALSCTQRETTNIKCFGKENIEQVLRDSNFLLNVHQTGEHHTLEELRVLPALVNGCTVVSEDVPLKEVIPYSKFIRWSRYDDLVHTTVFARTMCTQERKELLQTLHDIKRKNHDNIQQIITRLI